MMAAAHTDMELRELFPGLASAAADLDVQDIAQHSAGIRPGSLFLACGGGRNHGLRFLDDALVRGAAAVAWEPEPRVDAPLLPAGVAGLEVPGLRGQLGALANRFFASPSRQLAVTGITGTNGKTTVAWLLMQALGQLGRRTGYMGTLGHGIAGRLEAAALTTPDCISVHRQLHQLLGEGAAHVAMEVSSHALDQRRIDGVSLHSVAFTNLGRDHLDYHGDMARYAQAKARLFLDCGAPVAVINLGDACGRGLAARLPAGMRLIGVSAVAGQPAAVSLRRLPGAGRQAGLQLAIEGTVAGFESPLLGDFNLENLAVTAGLLHAEGFAPADIAAALAGCQAPPGRMQPIAAAHGPQVLVDFAHTPEALRRALETLRAEVPAQLWCVFGCGGERDTGKRALMGAVARELADRLVLTDDNPRGEDPDAIIAAILEGSGRGPQVEVIRDRAAAIRHAIAAAGPQDIVLIAGKGHESVQLVGGEAHPFSDQLVAGAALAGRP